MTLVPAPPPRRRRGFTTRRSSGATPPSALWRAPNLSKNSPCCPKSKKAKRRVAVDLRCNPKVVWGRAPQRRQWPSPFLNSRLHLSARVACLRIPVVQVHPGKRQTPRTPSLVSLPRGLHAAPQRHSVGHDLHLAHVLALEPKVLKSPASGSRWFKSTPVKDKLLVLPRSSLLRLGPETGERTRARDELARARGRALRSGRVGYTCAAGVAR